MTRTGRRMFTIAYNFYGRVFNWMENKWAASHPPTYRVYRLFKGGLQVSFTDFSRFGSARRRLLEGQGLESLSVKELDAIRRVPRDMLKLTPVIIVAVLPGSFLFLPIFYMFPRRLLTARFWSQEQRQKFESEDVKKRISSFARINQRLLKHSPADAKVLRKIINELKSGKPAMASEVVTLSPIFHEKPLHISSLSLLHLETICRCHVCKNFSFFLRSRLETLARILHNQDKAILREGLQSLEREVKEELCLHRGLLPYELSVPQMDEFLTRWCSVSSRLQTNEDISLILHLPPLLSQHWHPTPPPVSKRSREAQLLSCKQNRSCDSVIGGSKDQEKTSTGS